MRALQRKAAKELSQEIKQRGTVVVPVLERHGEHPVKFALSRTVVSI